MPYLKVTCPDTFEPHFPTMAERLTAEINTLFFNPQARISKEELRERTTVHFNPYTENHLFIGARTPTQRGYLDITVELSDWLMSIKKQRIVAKTLTPVLAQLFGIDNANLEHVNIYFNSYPPTNFSVGGILLSDLVPFAGRLAKRIFE